MTRGRDFFFVFGNRLREIVTLSPEINDRPLGKIVAFVVNN